VWSESVKAGASVYVLERGGQQRAPTFIGVCSSLEAAKVRAAESLIGFNTVDSGDFWLQITQHFVDEHTMDEPPLKGHWTLNPHEHVGWRSY
jgi:hypothetical protein